MNRVQNAGGDQQSFTDRGRLCVLHRSRGKWQVGITVIWLDIGYTQLHSGHRAVDSVEAGAWYTAVDAQMVLSASLGHSLFWCLLLQPFPSSCHQVLCDNCLLPRAASWLQKGQNEAYSPIIWCTDHLQLSPCLDSSVTEKRTRTSLTGTCWDSKMLPYLSSNHPCLLFAERDMEETRERRAKRAVGSMPQAQKRTAAHSTCLQFLKDLCKGIQEWIYSPVELLFITSLLFSGS